MTSPNRSMLLISPDAEVAKSIGRAVSGFPNLTLRSESGTVSGLNGQAARMVGAHDFVLFQTDPQDDREMAAIAALTAGRRPGSIVVALAADDLPLSKVQALKAAGVDDVLPVPAPGAGLDIDFARITAARRSGAAAQATSGHVIVVAQARGGIGATTVAVNLADQLCATQRFLRKPVTHRVAIVDLDLQFGSVGSMLDLPEQDTLLQLALDGTIPDTNFLRQSMTTLPSGLAVLAAPSRFAPLESLRPEQVAAIIDVLRSQYEYVIVDLPRALVSWIEPVMQRADELILVTDTSVPAIRHCRRLIDFFTADNVMLPVQVVVNHQSRPVFGSEAQRAAAKALDRKIVHWLPDDPRHARAAVDHGKPLSSVAARAPLSRAFGRLAQSVLTDHPAGPPARPAR